MKVNVKAFMNQIIYLKRKKNQSAKQIRHTLRLSNTKNRVPSVKVS